MGVFKKRTNKKYNYTPRYYNSTSKGSPFEIKHKFDEYRKTIGPKPGIKSKINNALNELKETPDKDANRRILIIVVVLVIIFLFFINFDLSIFFNS